MSGLVNTPLGDSLYQNIGQVIVNNWGVTIPVDTDLLGGGAPNHIPNPPLVGEFSQSWGGSDSPIQPYVPPVWPKPHIPEPQCGVLCEPQTPPADVVPEPSTGLLLAGAAMLALVAGRLRK